MSISSESRPTSLHGRQHALEELRGRRPCRRRARGCRRARSCRSRTWPRVRGGRPPGAGRDRVEVPVHEAVGCEFGDRGVDRCSHACIVGGQEAHERGEEVRRVRRGAAERLHERTSGRMDAARLDGSRIVWRRAHHASMSPARLRARAKPDRAIDRDPRHDLRRHEVAAARRVLPRCPRRVASIARRPPRRHREQVPERVGDVAAGPVVQPRGVEQIAVHVELELFGRGVADAYGPGAAVSVERVDVVFRQVPLAADAVHDLQITRAARRWCARSIP